MVTYDLDVETKGIKTILIQSDSDHIEELKKIVPSLNSTNVIKEKKKNIYELTFSSIKTTVPKLLINPTFGEISSKKEIKEEILDFENSDKFYNFFKDDEEIGIITDEFSNLRNKKIYEGFMSVEEKIRELIIIEYTDKSIKNKQKPIFKEEKIVDHIICQYKLSEIFELFLYSQASDKFILQKWKESEKDESSIVSLTKLTRLEELNFPLSKKELKKIKSCRNGCMHFRTLSMDEYSKVVKIINKYLKFDFEKRLGDVFSPFIKEVIEAQKYVSKFITEYQSNIKSLVEAASVYRNNFSSIIEEMTERKKQYQSLIKDLCPTGTKL